MGNFKEYFSSKVLPTVQQDILRQVFEGYDSASKTIKAQDLQPGPGKNLSSYTRIAHIDNNLLALNNKYSGLKATSEINSVHNWFYTLISIENIKMTASAVDSINTMPRESSFRNNLASCQFRFDIKDNLEFTINALKNIKDVMVYALIIHSPMVDNPRLPGFAQIVFPNEDCTRYLDRINLFKEFPDLVEQLIHKDMNHIPDKADVKLGIQEKQN